MDIHIMNYVIFKGGFNVNNNIKRNNKKYNF